MEVKSVCRPCGGTGLYRGMSEPTGVAVVCLECGGTGCKTIRYEPFQARARRNDVRTVWLSRGCLIATGVGPTGGSISYEDFLAGKMP